jgi:hypothetical protein
LPVAAPATEIPDPKNEFYKSNEELQVVIAEAMRTEYKMKKCKMILYKMIVDAVLLLQVDDVRNRHLRRWRPSKAFGAGCRNRPISSTTPSKTCRPTASAITCAGAHGWQAWKIVKLAAGQMLVPGVINHDTNVAGTSSPAPIAAVRRGRLSALKLQTIGRRGPLASKRLWP